MRLPKRPVPPSKTVPPATAPSLRNSRRCMMTFFLYETREFLLDFENGQDYTPKSLAGVRFA
jgi:hypothetical protein